MESHIMHRSGVPVGEVSRGAALLGVSRVNATALQVAVARDLQCYENDLGARKFRTRSSAIGVRLASFW